MRCVSVLLLTLPYATAANQPAFVYTLSANFAAIGVNAVTVDSAGNTYLTGYTNSAIPVTPDAYQPQLGEVAGVYCPNGQLLSGSPVGICFDAFLIELDPTGAVMYGTYLGGFGNDAGTAVAIDAAGNIYVGGTTQPPLVVSNGTPTNNFPVTPGAAFTTSSIPSAFIAKFDPTAHTLIYSTYIPGVTSGVGMALDAAGNAYIASSTNPLQAPFPTTPGALQTSPKNNLSAGVIAALNASGSALIYATYLSGSMTSAQQTPDSVNGIAVDASGDAYITGFTAAGDFPVTAGAFQTTLPNSTSAAFATKLNPQGNAALYSTFLGGNSADFGQAIKVHDLQGEAWVLGQTSSPNFPLTSSPFESTPDDHFLIHLSSDGASLTYATYFPGIIGGGQALDLNAAGEPYVAATVSTSGLPTGPAPFQSNFSGGVADVYIAKFAPSGQLLGASYLGGSSVNYVNLIAAAPDGKVVVTGVTQSSDFPGVMQPLPSGRATFVTSLLPSLTLPVKFHRQDHSVR